MYAVAPCPTMLLLWLAPTRALASAVRMSFSSRECQDFVRAGVTGGRRRLDPSLQSGGGQDRAKARSMGLRRISRLERRLTVIAPPRVRSPH